LPEHKPLTIICGKVVRLMMKILLAVDGSDCSKAAVEEFARRPWPAGSKLRIVTVVDLPLISLMPRLGMENFHIDISKTLERAARVHARSLIDEVVATVQKSENKDISITGKILKGSPKRLILDEAEKWAATLIMVGAHDYRDSERAMFGSVSQAVAVNAKCSVEIVRRQKTAKRGARK
jgi:nucleotide-binding universal stress UspA family protein